MWPFGKSIKDRVQDALNEIAPLKGLGLTITERSGNVAISGSVPRLPHLNLIGITARGVSGVKNVDVSGISVAEQAQAEQEAQVRDALSTSEAIAISAQPISLSDTDPEIQAALDASMIAKRVYNAIKGNNELKDDPIDVLQSGTSVVLRGAVDSLHEYNLAIQLAEAVEGVTNVDSSGLRFVEGAKAKAQDSSNTAAHNPPDEWYVVAAGDTLSEIAQKFYGDAGAYKMIARANGIANPDLIKVGQKLQIPR
jgi:nucleoid-associated protein YgaU